MCLNGKTFASNGTKKIEIRENSRFILCDCVGGGTIDGADNCWGGAGIYFQNSTMDMYGGKITGGHTGNGGGGAIALDDVNCIFNMYGGEISGNKAARNGGAVYMFRATSTLNLSGGTIKNNTAGSSGGAVYFNTTSDGKIQGILNISGNPMVRTTPCPTRQTTLP